MPTTDDDEGWRPSSMSGHFGRANPHCCNCGDLRGGPFGHESSECLYRNGMTARELADTMDSEKRSKYWDFKIDQYFRERGI